MIYPSTTGKADGNEIRLRTLESVWIQGKLRMWGRWSHIGGGSYGNMFNHLLARKKITKTAIKQALRILKKSGVEQYELESFLKSMITANQKCHLAFCTDDEALLIDKAIGKALGDYPFMIRTLQERYIGHGKSKHRMAIELHKVHPEWSLRTCRNRIDQWLCMAEYLLFIHLHEACVNSKISKLK